MGKINLGVTGEIMGSDPTTTTWEYHFEIIIVFQLHIYYTPRLHSGPSAHQNPISTNAEEQRHSSRQDPKPRTPAEEHPICPRRTSAPVSRHGVWQDELRGVAPLLTFRTKEGCCPRDVGHPAAWRERSFWELQQVYERASARKDWVGEQEKWPGSEGLRAGLQGLLDLAWHIFLQHKIYVFRQPSAKCLAVKTNQQVIRSYAEERTK